MVKKFLLFLFIIISARLAASPFTVYIKGIVVDTATGESVPGANVNIIAKTFWGSLIYSNSTVTDRLGHFSDSFLTDVSGFLRITATDSSFGTVDTMMTFSVNNTTLSATIQVVREEDPCVASFTWESDITEAGKINFTNTSSGGYTRTVYDFGDGSTDTIANPSHYFAPGTYNVCLTVSSPLGCFDKRCETIYIAEPASCRVEYTYSQTTGYEVAFQATTTSSLSTEFTWFLGDGLQATGKNITHNFDAAGIYTVSVHAVDISGCEDTHTGQIEVTEEIKPCQAAFRFIPDPQNPNFFHFTDASTGEITAWSWKFGDGDTSDVENPHHLYDQSGRYDVSLHISNPGTGCNDSVTSSIDIGLGYYFTIAGQVFAGDFPADSTEVDVYRMNDGAPSFVGSFTSGPYGIFHFYALTNGIYILKAGLKSTSPEYGKYLTTYYHRVAFWEEARQISLTADSTNIAFYLIPNPDMSNGPGTIDGHIYYHLNEAVREEVPAGYMPILLFDEGREPIHGVFSLEDGYFEFTDVPEGSWKLQPEITGLNVDPMNIYIDNNNTSQENLIVTVENDGVTFGIGIIEHKNNLSSGLPQPNPATDHWSINLASTKLTSVTVRLFSSDGRLVFTSEEKLLAGENLLNFSSAKFSRGAYFVVIQDTDGATVSHKLFFE